MNYLEYIEKEASLKDTALNQIKKHKKALIGAGTAGAGLGGAYLLGNDEQKAKIRNGTKVAAKSVATGMFNGGAQEALSNSAALAGTALALRKMKGSNINAGRKLLKAVGTGGIGGMALGDIVGASTIPTYQLIKKHKKEFNGELPDKKSVGAIAAANVLPTAALWGGLYGLKKGRALKTKINRNLVGSMLDIRKAGKQIGNGLKTKPPRNHREMMRQGSKSRGSQIVGGSKRLVKSLVGVGGALAPIAGFGKLAELPTYAVTPDNVIMAKKNRIKNNERN